MRRYRGLRRKGKQEKKESIQNVADDLNSLFGAGLSEKSKEEPEIIRTEVFRLSEEEKKEILENSHPNSETKIDEKPKTGAGKIFHFIKKHVRPDISIGPFNEGEEPNIKNDDLYEIGEKLKKNLRVGLKLTIKF